MGLDETTKAYAAGWSKDGAQLLALADRSTTAARKIIDLLSNQEVCEP